MSTSESPPQRHSDSTQLARQWAILRLLAESGRSFSAKELADQLGTSKATIQRDLATIEQEFALLVEPAGKQKKLYRIDESIRALGAITFAPFELLAIHAAASASSMRGTVFSSDLAAIAGKIRGFLSPRHNGGLDAMTRVFLPHRRGEIDYAGQREVIDDLIDAIARRKSCRAVYHAAWKGTTREHGFRPLRLIWHRAALYLLCLIDGRSEITTLAVQRIERLEVSRESFPPPRVDVETHVRRAFGIFVSDAEEDVEILFHKDIAWRISERSHHPDEEKELLDDGRLRYRVRSSAQWEIVPWVLSFGGHAELVAPASWRAAITDALADMVATYSSP